MYRCRLDSGRVNRVISNYAPSPDSIMPAIEISNFHRLAMCELLRVPPDL
jgi:hypothetical protein